MSSNQTALAAKGEYKKKRKKSQNQLRKNRYQRAVFILGKIARDQAAGTPVAEAVSEFARPGLKSSKAINQLTKTTRKRSTMPASCCGMWASKKSEMPNNLRCVQIYLQHSKSATANLTTIINERGIDISLIQEPWVNEDTIKGLNNSNYTLFYTRNKAQPITQW